MPSLLATFAFLLSVARLGSYGAEFGASVAARDSGVAAAGSAATLERTPCAAEASVRSDGFTRAHRCVATSRADAQAAFDDGLTLLYAFNPEQARRSFELARADDPTLAIAAWGVAMSYGPNINSSYEPVAQRHGRDAIAQAAALAAAASPAERALIAAAEKRFAFDRPTDAERSARAYRDAMYAAAALFAEDDDIRALAAESEMDVHPWSYFTGDGKPTPGTLGLIDHLRAVLARSPQHIGANHFAIHAFEESRRPQDAAASAQRLAAAHFEPAAEHLTHMPAHTFMRIGDYHAAGDANARAVAAYDAYLAQDHVGHAEYYGHDCFFGVAAYMMSGERARATALATACHHGNGDLRQLINLRFRDWAALAADGGADEFGAGLLLAREGRVALAERHVRTLRSSGDSAATIESVVLEARIARARGNAAAELAALQHAVALQDAGGYAEPPSFWYPVRETLGGAYLRAARYEDAERTFLADLERTSDNPRSLFGLAAVLDLQNRSAEAAAVRVRFARAWAQADATLDVNEL